MRTRFLESRMRENRTYGSEGGEPVMDYSPTPIHLAYMWELFIR